MAHSNQARKRIRQNEVRRLHNKARMSALRSMFKKVMDAAVAGDKATVTAKLSDALSRVDKAAKTNLIHKNTAARKKSQLMRAVAAMK
jgi:small subunit ribosomal protein S20